MRDIIPDKELCIDSRYAIQWGCISAFYFVCSDFIIRTDLNRVYITIRMSPKDDILSKYKEI